MPMIELEIAEKSVWISESVLPVALFYDQTVEQVPLHWPPSGQDGMMIL